MKRIISIPIERLCRECGRGRMLATGVRRTPTLGEYDSIVYRRCSNPSCKYSKHAIPTQQKMLGVEVEEPDDQPGLFDSFPEDG